MPASLRIRARAQPAAPRPRAARADLARLVVAAALTLAVYTLLWVVPYPLLRWYDVPLQDLGKLADFDPLHALWLLAGYSFVFVCYAYACRVAARLSGRAAFWLVIGASVAFGLCLLWVYPVGANDIYDYIFRARLWGMYNYNPLTVTPLQVNDDPWFRYVVWVWFSSPYGPLWSEISVLLYRLAGDSLLANLLLFKLLAMACAALSAAVVYALSRERGEGEALSGVVLFAWNPLLLFEAAVNGHNDLVMVVLLLAGLWFYRRGRLGAALVFCTLAGLVKLAAFLALPVLLMAVALRLPEQPHGRRVRMLAGGLLVCLFSALCVYAPLWRGAETFAGTLALDNRFTASLAAVVKLALEASVGREPAELLARTAFVLLFVAVYAWLLQRAARARQAVELTLNAAVTALLVLGTLWFQPWYFTWLLALAPLADRRWRRMAIFGSAGALGLYGLYNFGWNWFPDFFNAANGLVLNASAAAVWLGSLALAWVVRPPAASRAATEP